MQPKKLNTKYGIATLDNHGYYWITSRKEGNHHKFLHRLIWEDFYGFKIPKGFHIHHKNGICTDNCILNLQLIREYDHYIHHNLGENSWWYGKFHSDETKLKMSKSKNTTGYYRVTKLSLKRYSQGYCFAYQWKDECGKYCRIKAKDIPTLEKRVKDRNLDWIKL